MSAELADLIARLPRAAGMCPEQVRSSLAEERGDEGEEAAPTAALIDRWGRAHPLRPPVIVGREPARAAVAVLESSVSRAHAELAWDPARGWTVRDLGSTNGTFVEGNRVAAATPLGDGQVVAFGDVGFVFALDRAAVAVRHLTESIRATLSVRPEDELGPALRLAPATTGGVVEHGPTSLQLGSTQFALLALLAARRRDEPDAPEATRGYVRSVELMTELPWDTPHPTDNHVKQMVRRLRKALERLGLPEAIESRHGFGYRLAVDAA